jgi:hypothetical protein
VVAQKDHQRALVWIDGRFSHVLEILEKAAASSKLNVVLGEKGLAERVVNLL